MPEYFNDKQISGDFDYELLTNADINLIMTR